MGRILALDYGKKRCGLAETDDLQIIASALDTIPTENLFTYLKTYIDKYPVDALVVGLPIRASGEASEIEADISKFIQRFQKNFPGLDVVRINEMYTSKLAMEAMIRGGARKKTRRVKENLDKISATIILQTYLEQA